MSRIFNRGVSRKFIGVVLVAFLSVSFCNITNAYELVTNVEPTGYSVSGGNLGCYYSDSSQNTSNTNYCLINSTGSSPQKILMQIVHQETLQVKKGNYYRTVLYLRSSSYNSQGNWGVVNIQSLIWNFTTNSNFNVVSTAQVSSQVLESSSEYGYYPYIVGYEIVLQANVTGNINFVLGNGGDILVWYPSSISLNVGEVKIDPIVEYEYKADTSSEQLKEMNERDNQDRSDIESQSEQTSSDASDSQADAENTGSTLLQAFTAFVSALTNAIPSNCNIDMDLGNLDLGVVNFCQLQPPPGFTTLSSIFMILFCVPLSLATARKVISLFRSFQT